MKLLNYESVVYLVDRTKQYCLEQVGNHEHSVDDITSGALEIAHGGTGATSAEAARTALNVYSVAEVDAIVGDISLILESLTGVSS